MTLDTEFVYPPANTPLVALAQPANTYLATVKSPKSVAFHVVAIVI